MNGFRNGRTLLAGLCGLAVAALGGCYGYHDLVDPCYPARYDAMSHAELNAAIAPQVHNGHVLDQTVWNFYFDAGTDRLNAAGLEKLSYLGRRRPAPDTTIWLQTAEDVVYDPAAPNKLVEARTELDNKRRESVIKYLNAETAGRGVTFNVVVHDPADAGFAARPLGASVTTMYSKFGGGSGGAGAGGAGGGATTGGAGGPPR
jgi:hypothetical protein